MKTITVGHFTSIAAVSIVLLTSACASQRNLPTAQLAVSQAALEDARRAGGREYAPVALTSAEEKLQRARTAADKKDYDSAQLLAEEAEADARLATASAQAAKSQNAALEVQKSVRTLQQELSTKTGQ